MNLKTSGRWCGLLRTVVGDQAVPVQLRANIPDETWKSKYNVVAFGDGGHPLDHLMAYTTLTARLTHSNRLGAEEAHRAHNPRVRRSKLRGDITRNIFFVLSLFAMPFSSLKG